MKSLKKELAEAGFNDIPFETVYSLMIIHKRFCNEGLADNSSEDFIKNIRRTPNGKYYYSLKGELR